MLKFFGISISGKGWSAKRTRLTGTERVAVDKVDSRQGSTTVTDVEIFCFFVSRGGGVLENKPIWIDGPTGPQLPRGVRCRSGIVRDFFACGPGGETNPFG